MSSKCHLQWLNVTLNDVCSVMWYLGFLFRWLSFVSFCSASLTEISFSSIFCTLLTRVEGPLKILVHMVVQVLLVEDQQSTFSFQWLDKIWNHPSEKHAANCWYFSWNMANDNASCMYHTNSVEIMNVSMFLSTCQDIIRIGLPYFSINMIAHHTVL